MAFIVTFVSTNMLCMFVCPFLHLKIYIVLFIKNSILE